MDIIQSEKTLALISRALNLIDGRLVDHGVRVAFVLNDMLRAEGCQNPELRKNLKILSLLHDIGAYRTEEIDNLVKFETANIWEHSIYGYLFLREFTPLKEWAKVILYHHANCTPPPDEPGDIIRYAQMLHIADRAVVWHDEVKRGKDELRAHFTRRTGEAFLPECIALFWEADRRFDTMAHLDAPIQLDAVMAEDALEENEAKDYLKMVVYSIDFRSRVTVTHTVSVVEIAAALADMLGMPPEVQEQIRYGALLHDLGKIGTPLEILEKPGRLTDEEMAVMRQHVVLSRQIIEGSIDDTVARIALRHHEKLDGSGYPLGLSAEDLTLPERVLSVADIVSALCMSRSYKAAFPKERCLTILREMGERGQLDEHIIRTMETHFDEIIRRANEVRIPLEEVYERITGEYKFLLEKFAK